VTRHKWKLNSVYIECTIGSKIVLMRLMELLDDVGHVESCFGLFGDSVSVGGR
jgi:hypothetical protein